MNGFASSLNPLRLSGKAVPEELVLIARGLALILCLKRDIPSRLHLPYLELLDRFGDSFDALVLAAAIMGGALIMCSLYVRTGCLLMGGAYLAGLVASRPTQSVAHTFVACMFLMIALSSHFSGTRLVRAQVILLYLGATLHKALDVDWWNGRYFETFLVQRYDHGSYIAFASLFPPMFVSTAMGVLTMVIELLIPILLWRQRTIVHGAALLAFFHVAMVLVVGHTFGPFVPAMLLSLIAFFPWPSPVASPVVAGETT